MVKGKRSEAKHIDLMMIAACLTVASLLTVEAKNYEAINHPESKCPQVQVMKMAKDQAH
jgi:hypothetical protein